MYRVEGGALRKAGLLRLTTEKAGTVMPRKGEH